MNRIFYILLFLCGYSILAQNTLDTSQDVPLTYDQQTDLEAVEFDSDAIEAFKNDPDFNYEIPPKEETWWDDFITWIGEVIQDIIITIAKAIVKFLEWVFGESYQGTPTAGYVFNAVPYILIGLIILFVVWIVYRLNPGARILERKQAPEVFFTEEEEIIKTRDIKALIQKALDAKDYRMAIRYHYLYVLQLFTDKKLIEYEFDKTNSDYLKEVKQTENNLLHSNFSKVTSIYEYIWYGNFDVNNDTYYKAQRQFSTIEQLTPKRS